MAQLDSIFISRSIEEIPSALISICDALSECRYLTELDLSSNAFGVRTVEPLASLLSTHLSLQVIKLANNGLNSEGGRIVAKSLVQAAKRRKELGQPPSLRVLILSRNRLEDASASAWAEAIAVNSALEQFEISNAGIREDGILALASGLVHCPDLVHLRLRDNVIANADKREGKRGWKAIADVIRGAKKLEYLDVSACFLQNDGCREVIDALGHQSYARLRTIRLDTNDFGEKHYARLRAAVSDTLPALRFLNLTGNEDLEDNSALEAISEMLASRGGNLELEDDDTDDEGGDTDEDGEEVARLPVEDAELNNLVDLITTKLAIKVRRTLASISILR